MTYLVICVLDFMATSAEVVTGTYHAFDFQKYANRYLGEYQYRFNRRFNLATMLRRLVVAAVKMDRLPEAKLRLAED
jgi:2-hydroxychromene-2-carboxylate isomerase